MAGDEVVFIPKSGKDTAETKSWRPINLINCMAKLAEKVVADELQNVQEFFHSGQYRGRRKRSAIDAVRRLVMRAQRATARRRGAAAIINDVKGAFNIVRGKHKMNGPVDETVPMTEAVRGML